MARHCNSLTLGFIEADYSVQPRPSKQTGEVDARTNQLDPGIVQSMKAGDGRETHTIDVLQFGEVHDNSMPLYQQLFNSFAERIGVVAKHEATGTAKHGHVIRDVTDHV
jgi:hypothetical protein